MNQTRPAQRPRSDDAGHNLLFLCNLLPLPIETLRDMRDHLARFYTTTQMETIHAQIKHKEYRHSAESKIK